MSFDLASAIYDPWTKPFYEYCETLRIDGFKRALKQNKRLIFTFCYVAPDDDAFVAQIKKLAKKYNKKVQFVRLVADVDTVLDRVENDERKNFAKINNRPELKKYLTTQNCCAIIQSKKAIEVDTTINRPKDSAKYIINTLEGR